MKIYDLYREIKEGKDFYIVCTKELKESMPDVLLKKFEIFEIDKRLMPNNYDEIIFVPKVEPVIEIKFK